MNQQSKGKIEWFNLYLVALAHLMTYFGDDPIGTNSKSISRSLGALKNQNTTTFSIVQLSIPTHTLFMDWSISMWRTRSLRISSHHRPWITLASTLLTLCLRDGDGFVQFSEIEFYYKTELINRLESMYDGMDYKKLYRKTGFMTITNFMAEVRVSCFSNYFFLKNTLPLYTL